MSDSASPPISFREITFPVNIDVIKQPEWTLDTNIGLILASQIIAPLWRHLTPDDLQRCTARNAPPYEIALVDAKPGETGLVREVRIKADPWQEKLAQDATRHQKDPSWQQEFIDTFEKNALIIGRRLRSPSTVLGTSDYVRNIGPPQEDGNYVAMRRPNLTLEYDSVSTPRNLRATPKRNRYPQPSS